MNLLKLDFCVAEGKSMSLSFQVFLCPEKQLHFRVIKTIVIRLGLLGFL